MAGFRVLELEEEFNIWNNDTGAVFDSVADNELYGFQVGAQALIWRWNRLRLESMFKTGVYYNNLGVTATSSNVQLVSTTSHISFAGELNLVLIYQFAPRMAIRAGYQGMWLGGVALAPDQSDDSVIATGLYSYDAGKVSYQGGLLGFELTW
jgi:hypothetical protein